VLDQALDTQVQIQAENSAAQERVDELDDESRRMLEEYRQLISELDGLREWNDRSERTVNGQEAEIARLERELEATEATRRGIEPLMGRMQSVLGELVERDLPFLPEERRARLLRLEELAEAPETAVAERFRALMEAYQVESGYGYGIEAYRGRLDDGSGRLVDFLRLGRLALYYRTLDGAEGGARSDAGDGWTALEPDQLRALGHALRVARKELPPDLLLLPVPAPEVQP
jgi:hypothetical protein